MALYTDDQLLVGPLLRKELLPNLFAILAGVFFGNPHGKNGLRIRNMLAEHGINLAAALLVIPSPGDLGRGYQACGVAG